MAEETFPAQVVIPGTFLRVQAEALISAGGVSTGNVGIVGTSVAGHGATHVLNDLPSARTALGAVSDTHRINRAIEILFRTGARTVYARGLDTNAATANDYSAAFDELVKDDVNILIAPELATNAALTVLGSVTGTAETNGKDLIAVVGSDAGDSADTANSPAANAIRAQVPDNPRIVFTAPAIRAFDDQGVLVSLPGGFTAAAVAGLLSSLAPQTSPTNKVIAGVPALARRFSYGQNVDLVGNRVLALEERSGVRVIRGLTSHDGAFAQVTTRRIVDFAKGGIRSVCDPFIGKLNNERVRGALQGAIAGFLDSMVENEMLIAYTLDVTATRQDEIAGRAVVNALLRPTFSIDFIMVTLVLE